MRRLQRKWLSALLCLGALVLALAPITALADHAGPQTWHSWYEGREITVMLGPSSNSSNPNQNPVPGCYNLGPDFREIKQSADVAVYYHLRGVGGHQMMCPDGARAHDMVFTKAPGDPGYTALVRTVYCDATRSFTAADYPITSAAAVKEAIAAGKLTCNQIGGVVLAPILGP